MSETRTTETPEVQDEIERAIRAGIIPMAATLMDVLPDDETRKALWGCCAKPKHQQPTFTDMMMRNHQPWIAANPKLWDAAYEAEANALDTIFCKNLKAPCNQPPLFRTPLADFYNITETAQQTTPQPVDGGEIARKSRSDKGGKHVTRAKRTSQWGKTAKAAAADFDKSRFIPERGAKPMGGCTETQIKQWDLKYPDAEHPHPRWGYYADLRLRADLKSEYNEVLQNWARYWADYKAAFREWRKAHPASRRESFRFTPMKKANGYNPEWIGQDENGTIYNAPTK